MSVIGRTARSGRGSGYNRGSVEHPSRAMAAASHVEDAPAEPSHARLGSLAADRCRAGGGRRRRRLVQYVRPPTGGKSEAGRATAAGDSDERSGKATLGFLDAAGQRRPRAPRRASRSFRVEVVPRCDVLRLTGSLIADERSSVASNTSGIAAEVRVDRGSLVRKNDVLVQIDPTDAKNKLAEGQAMLDELKARLGLDENTRDFNPEDEPEVRLAKASADLAASNLKRAKDLYAKKVISTEAFDQTQTEYELAAQRYRHGALNAKTISRFMSIFS